MVYRKVLLQCFGYFHHLTMTTVCINDVFVHSLLHVAAVLHQISMCCSVYFYRKIKRKREKEKGLLMCVISKDQSWGVERGHIISSSKCSSTERHIRHLPSTAKREQLWAERKYQHVSVWGKRKFLCLKVLLDDWSSAVVKNRLLQQLLHRLLSLACSASTLS